MTSSGHPAGTHSLQRTYTGLVVTNASRRLELEPGRRRLSAEVATMPCAQVLQGAQQMKAGETAGLVEWAAVDAGGVTQLLRARGDRYLLSPTSAGLYGVTVNDVTTATFDVTCALSDGACPPSAAPCAVTQTAESRRMLEWILDAGDEEVDALLAIERDDELAAALKEKEEVGRRRLGTNEGDLVS